MLYLYSYNNVFIIMHIIIYIGSYIIKDLYISI